MQGLALRVIKFFLKKYLFLDEDTRRPLAGIAVFNENFMNYKTRYYKDDVATFVHEIMHALFFSDYLFKSSFPTYNGQSYYYDAGDGFAKLRGKHILETIREFFNCPTAEGGKIKIIKSN